MIVPDTSAWVELRRATQSPAHHTLRRLLETEAAIATTEPVVMELLAGARSRRDLIETRGVLLALPLVRVGGLATYEHAADIARRCRLAGSPLSHGLDTLIAAVAIREGAAVLHADRDFDVMAEHTELRIADTVTEA
jgi:predicted nucleic acid-binding protein